MAFNRVVYSLADRTAEKNGVLATCKRLGVGIVAASPLGEGSRVTNTTHGECDQALVEAARVPGRDGRRRGAAVAAAGCAQLRDEQGSGARGGDPDGSVAWECGGSMLWRLDENAVGIPDERCEAVEKGETGDGGGPALA